MERDLVPPRGIARLRASLERQAWWPMEIRDLETAWKPVRDRCAQVTHGLLTGAAIDAISESARWRRSS